MEFDKKILSFLKPDLVDKILNESAIEEFPKGTEILREKQYIKVFRTFRYNR
jgi:CRP/FNR family transcriptional regulator